MGICKNENLPNRFLYLLFTARYQYEMENLNVLSKKADHQRFTECDLLLINVLISGLFNISDAGI